MIYDRLRVFVSSTMDELAAERAAAKDALSELNMAGWVYEEDAGARPVSGQEAYKEQIDSSDLYVGIFWREYGDYTIDEFRYAAEQGKDRLVYEKRTDIDGKRDSTLQQFLDEASNVETGVAVRFFDTPEQLKAGIKEDAAKWQARKVREHREVNAHYQQLPFEPGEQRTLDILLRKVKRFWVDGVLQSTTERAGLLELGKDTQPDAVESPWEAVVELPFEGARPVETGKSIVDVFDDIENSMLILGQPGAGKTTTMLMLAEALIQRAGRDRSQPVPVIFHLSTWASPKQSFGEWLVSELQDKYEIPSEIGRSCLERQRLVLLLDGLDEVALEYREACVDAIKAYAKEFGYPGISVCCRLTQYEELSAKLNLNGAICLRPLSDAQIDAYVSDAGPDLDGLRTAIGQDAGIRELARSPLMLNLMCISYRGYEPERLAGLEDPEDRSTQLFETYVDLMFRKRGTTELPFSREKTLGWLSGIARRLDQRSQAMFLVESLQPSWLTNRGQRATYLVVLSILMGLVMAVASIAFRGAGTFDVVDDPATHAFLAPGEWKLWLTISPLWLLIYSWLENTGGASGKAWLERPRPGMPRALSKCFVGALLWMIVAWGTANVLGLPAVPDPIYWSGIVIALVLGAMGRNRSLSFSIRTVETFRWSLSDAWLGALLGFIGGLIAGVPLIVFDELQQKIPADTPPLVPIIGFALVGLGTGALLGGLTSHVIDTKTRPNQGMKLTARLSLLMALNAIWLVGFAAIFASASGFTYTPNPDYAIFGSGIPMLGNFIGMFVALSLWFGGLDVLKHYVLRFVMSMSGNMPWNLGRFLEHARSLSLMQSAGNAYIFVHRRLRDFLAADGRVRSS